MSTKKLAKKLGLFRQRSQSSDGQKKSLVSNQTFSYLIVIDFESTCWREKTNYGQEIIEFPAVLLNTSTGEIESEFHTYVQPQEHPVLSEFCTELTGITQIQVEAGIPLQICLSRFNRWLQKLQLEMGVVFPNKKQRSSVPAPSQKLCTFVTWSDWDLGVCLLYECKRKQIHKPDVLSSWIDLRSTYRMFYARKPKGLNGALQDLGIQFAGREHSGLDDSRNTAQLAARMMKDGCVMRTTRSLERTPLTVKPLFGNTTADNKKEQSNTEKEKNKPSSSKIPLKSCQIMSCSENNTRDLATKENQGSAQELVQICQSLISPKTLLNGTATTPLWGRSRRSVSAEAVACIPSSVMINFRSHHNNNNNNSSLVLCSTTVGCLSTLPQPNQSSNTGVTVRVVEEEEGAEPSVEIEDRCGSYDDVVLEGDDEDDVTREVEGEFDVKSATDFDSGCHVWEQPDKMNLLCAQVTLMDSMRKTVSVGNYFKPPKMTTESSMKSLYAKMSSNMSSHLNQIGQSSEPNHCFAVPKTVTQNTKSVQEKSDGPRSKNSKTNTTFPSRHNRFVPEKTSTPHTSFAMPKAVTTTHHKKPTENPMSSFTIYTDSAAGLSCPSSRSSISAPKNALSSLLANSKAGQRITAPLCVCGRRAKRQVVANGGPNHGRGFFCCPVRRSGSGCRVQKGCEFFKWESALMNSSSVASPTVRASVSLCQMNNIVSSCPPQKSTIRKSY